jgi:hypothetical protein
VKAHVAVVIALAGVGCRHTPVSGAEVDRAGETKSDSVTSEAVVHPATLQEARDWSMGLIQSMPEWRLRAAATARTPGAVLGLVCDEQFSPAGCFPGRAPCQLGCEAIRVCETGGCGGGRWINIEVDPWRGALRVSDEQTSEMLAYGEWRERFRAQADVLRGPDYRTLATPPQTFPTLQPNSGEFGYGSPRSTSTDLPASLRAAFSHRQHQFLRAETYGDAGFLLLVLRRTTGLPTPSSSAPRRGDFQALRAWGATLVRANQLRPCEVVLQNSDGSQQRFQFDRFVVDTENSGAYVLVEDAFQPWRPM